VAWPVAARAQQRAIPVMGYLTAGRIPASLSNSFLVGLAQAGYVPGRNLAIEFRWANFQNSTLLEPRAAMLDELAGWKRVYADAVSRK
jgi:putative ABC transport system substrate-binding protein